MEVRSLQADQEHAQNHYGSIASEPRDHLAHVPHSPVQGIAFVPIANSVFMFILDGE